MNPRPKVEINKYKFVGCSIKIDPLLKKAKGDNCGDKGNCTN